MWRDGWRVVDVCGVVWCPEGSYEKPLVSGDRRGSVPLVVSCVSSTVDSCESLSSGSSSATPSRLMVSYCSSYLLFQGRIQDFKNVVSKSGLKRGTETESRRCREMKGGHECRGCNSAQWVWDLGSTVGSPTGSACRPKRVLVHFEHEKTHVMTKNLVFTTHGNCLNFKSRALKVWCAVKKLLTHSR